MTQYLDKLLAAYTDIVTTRILCREQSSYICSINIDNTPILFIPLIEGLTSLNRNEAEEYLIKSMGGEVSEDSNN